jgi:hypothetical protein
VIVKPQVEWADYIFEESYELGSLEEVSSFIEKEGHLPDVPSAESVEQHGLRLGEMDATLLQKMEELTLYSIKQNERADSLDRRLSVQKVRADSLSEHVQSLQEQLRKARHPRPRQIETLRDQI